MNKSRDAQRIFTEITLQSFKSGQKQPGRNEQQEARNAQETQLLDQGDRSRTFSLNYPTGSDDTFSEQEHTVTRSIEGLISSKQGFDSFAMKVG